MGDGVSVMVSSAVQLSEGVPTSIVEWTRVTAPIVTKRPTPSAAESAFQLPRRRWMFMGFISFSFIESSRYAEVVICRNTGHWESRVASDRHGRPTGQTVQLIHLSFSARDRANSAACRVDRRAVDSVGWS